MVHSLPTHFVSLGKQIIGGSTFSANFILWLKSGYFCQKRRRFRSAPLDAWRGGTVLPHLSVDLRSVLPTKSRWTLPLAFLVIAMVSMAINVTFVVSHRDATFFLPFRGFGNYLWEQGSPQLASESAGPVGSHILANWRTPLCQHE